MPIENEVLHTKLKFLADVAQKEFKHLKFSQTQVFSTPFTVENASSLLEDEILAEKVEAFTSRFCRYQDTLGDKLLPTWLELVGEKQKTFLDNLNKLEKLGIIESAETWLQLRSQLNKMVHEYISSHQLLADALNEANQNISFLQTAMQKTIQDLKKRNLA